MKPKHPCRVCSKACTVNQKAILFDLCNSWIHKNCTDLSVEQFEELGAADLTYYCQPCVCELFPFAKLNSSQFKTQVKFGKSSKKIMLSSNIKLKYPCKQCSKSCKSNQNCICCDICNMWYHIKCVSLTLSQFNSLKANSSMPYFCSSCMSETLPIDCQESLDHCQIHDVEDYLSLNNIKKQGAPY